MDPLKSNVPLKTIGQAFLWMAARTPSEFTFQLIQQPICMELSDDIIKMSDKTTYIVSGLLELSRYWHGVTFPCDVSNLHVWMQNHDGTSDIKIVDNRNTNIVLNNFNIKERLSLDSGIIHLTWTIDTNIYRFDVTPQTHELMNVSHMYTLARNV